MIKEGSKVRLNDKYVDWKPDKNKNCEKCKHYHKLYSYGSTRDEPEDCGGNDCSPMGYELDEDVSDNLHRIIELINEFRGLGMSEEFPFENGDEISNYNMVLANICPLYSHEKEDDD
ncbi:hypothetical protein [Methanobrevibacter arboriphilus]|uniref:Uncharacterized protein n=1 Tax=Methanobrevibacter arboriphilus TaxID=39441 RepID=A0ACA8R414_METAZ|nr:hypothetical protein [Methanobrevibacter arboriphilus]BBL62381.1 hypothetical protein MarbSA_14210 [Methanobrevibacter arboriphilus]